MSNRPSSPSTVRTSAYGTYARSVPAFGPVGIVGQAKESQRGLQDVTCTSSRSLTRLQVRFDHNIIPVNINMPPSPAICHLPLLRRHDRANIRRHQTLYTKMHVCRRSLELSAPCLGLVRGSASVRYYIIRALGILVVTTGQVSPIRSHTAGTCGMIQSLPYGCGRFWH